MADDARTQAIFDAAAARAKQKNAPMAGLLTPVEAWELFKGGQIELVDTRTHAERDLIGYVPGTRLIEWYDYPGKVRNARFLTELRDAVPTDKPVAFLCRSGVRSHHAAALAASNGYRRAFNVIEGFEGDKNAQGQRRVNGWQMAGLPWKQD
ncbi:MAG TPA: rhodanese-like domain-containing protein [Casimicrobiaceae bacterium]|nr:rhodanese-like domain-containing protein [Casimicrobiaceae bacterium]